MSLCDSLGCRYGCGHPGRAYALKNQTLKAEEINDSRNVYREFLTDGQKMQTNNNKKSTYGENSRIFRNCRGLRVAKLIQNKLNEGGWETSVTKVPPPLFLPHTQTYPPPTHTHEHTMSLITITV